MFRKHSERAADDRVGTSQVRAEKSRRKERKEKNLRGERRVRLGGASLSGVWYGSYMAPIQCILAATILGEAEEQK